MAEEGKECQVGDFQVVMRVVRVVRVMKGVCQVVVAGWEVAGERMDSGVVAVATGDRRLAVTDHQMGALAGDWPAAVADWEVAVEVLVAREVASSLRPVLSAGHGAGEASPSW